MNKPRMFIGLIIILIGISALFDFPFFKILFAFLLMVIGFRIATGSGKRWGFEKHGESKDDEVKQVFIFSGVNQKVISNDFRKAEVVTIFGGADIDLSEVKTKKPSVPMEFVAIFGGIRVKIPSDWNVRSEGVGILGGFTNNTKGEISGKATAHIKGVAILGGVEILDS